MIIVYMLNALIMLIVLKSNLVIIVNVIVVSKVMELISVLILTNAPLQTGLVRISTNPSGLESVDCTRPCRYHGKILREHSSYENVFGSFGQRL